MRDELFSPGANDQTNGQPEQKTMEARLDQAIFNQQLRIPLVAAIVSYIADVSDQSLYNKGYDVPTVHRWTIQLSNGEVPSGKPNGEPYNYPTLLAWATDAHKLLEGRKPRIRLIE